MGADVNVFAERRTATGWEPAQTRWCRHSKREVPAGFFEFNRYHLITYVLSGYKHYRLDVSDLPPPIVHAPRGRPADVSPQLLEWCGREYVDAVSSITPAEILTYDWHPLLAISPFLAEFLDQVARLEPPEDHRLVTWLDW